MSKTLLLLLALIIGFFIGRETGIYEVREEFQSPDNEPDVEPEIKSSDEDFFAEEDFFKTTS